MQLMATSAPTTVPAAAPSPTMDHSAHMMATAAPTPASASAPTVKPATPYDAAVGDPFSVSLAQYYMDTAGFHDMATAISNTKKLDGNYANTVNQTKKILAQVTWGTKLGAQAQEFIGSLGKLAAALTAKNVADATKVSGVVHDQQHALSHTIDDWAASQPGKAPSADPLNVSLAQNILDTTGFHDVATTLSNTQKIDTSYLSKVNRAKKVLSQTTWPATLDGDAQKFIALIGKFADALSTNNVADAVKLSADAHDAQHALSHSINDWLATKPAKAQKASPFGLAMTQYFMDYAGFHEMATKLDETKTIDAAYQTPVDRVKKLVAQTTWPAELDAPAQEFLKSLTDFSTALSKKDVAGAVKAADAVHDQQHELSFSIDEWLAKAAK